MLFSGLSYHFCSVLLNLDLFCKSLCQCFFLCIMSSINSFSSNKYTNNSLSPNTEWHYHLFIKATMGWALCNISQHVALAKYPSFYKYCPCVSCLHKAFAKHSLSKWHGNLSNLEGMSVNQREKSSLRSNLAICPTTWQLVIFEAIIINWCN